MAILGLLAIALIGVGSVVCWIVQAVYFLASAAVRAVSSRLGRPAVDRRQDVRLTLFRADAEVERAARRARAEMNNAAGQSWRNLAG